MYGTNRQQAPLPDRNLDPNELLRSAINIADVINIDKAFRLGVNVKWRDTQGFTLLHIAAEQGNTYVIKKLLEKGANIDDAKNVDWDTPLILAVFLINLMLFNI